jgi:two-component system response regulator FixJ
MLRTAVVNVGDVHMAVKAMKAGAHDCVEKPLGREWWRAAIEKATLQWRGGQERSNTHLTETERFVLRQVLAGRTSKEIAWTLHRSPRTVEVHRTHIIQKLGVSSTVDLIRQAVAMELQDSPSCL